MKVSAALSPQCHLHIHCDLVLLLPSMSNPCLCLLLCCARPGAPCSPGGSLFSHHAAYTMQLTPCSSHPAPLWQWRWAVTAPTVMDTTDTQNFSAQNLSCPQTPMDCCHLSLLGMKASKGMLGFRIGPDRLCWLLCKLLDGHCLSVGSGVVLGCCRQSPPMLFLLKCSLVPVQHHGTWLCHVTQVGWRCQRWHWHLITRPWCGTLATVGAAAAQGAAASPVWRYLSCKTDHSLHQAGVDRSLCRRVCIGCAWR